MQGRWGLRYACDFTASFHVILGGTCTVRCNTTNQTLDLNPGDLVFFSRGFYHEIKSDLYASSIDIEQYREGEVANSGKERLAGGEARVQKSRNQRTGSGGVRTKQEIEDPTTPDPSSSEDVTSGGETRFISGRYLFPSGPMHPLFRALPDYFHIRGSSLGPHDSIKHLVELLSAEFLRKDASHIILSRLTDTLFHYILRHWILENESETHWSALYSDEAVLRAIESMEDALDRAWTVESLARAQGLSRATLARRFKEVTGTGPMDYLNQIRMQRAARLIQQESGTIEHVARSVGYDSPFSFSRSFKRTFGMAPASFRKNQKGMAKNSTGDRPRTS